MMILWLVVLSISLFIHILCFCCLDFKGRVDVPKVVKAYMDKKLKLDEFITHNMTLDRINDAIELMKHGKW